MQNVSSDFTEHMLTIHDHCCNHIVKTYSNMTSFVGYINNTMIKLTIYFNSHMHIDEHITNIQTSFLTEFMYSYRIVVHTNMIVPILVLYLYFFRNKYLKQPSIDFDIYNLTFSGDVVYKEC
jgi:hypothetical protein